MENAITASNIYDPFLTRSYYRIAMRQKEIHLTTKTEGK